MSKECGSANLRLMGSPVNLTYRSKKKDDKKNIRNRPRSALQSSCFTPDLQEKTKRPFSADTKPHSSSFGGTNKSPPSREFDYKNYSLRDVKVVPPTTQLLGDFKNLSYETKFYDKELCSNASDYGSEDTFVSLGTKIKAKAQVNCKNSYSNKNKLKYREIAKRENRNMHEDNFPAQDVKATYDVEVKISEKQQMSNESQSNENKYDSCHTSPSERKSYESYFVPLEERVNLDTNSLVGRVSFGSGSVSAEIDHAIDTYSHRLNLNKQQLSLVEEESTHDLESNPSQPFSSLSPQATLERKDEKPEQFHVLETENYIVSGHTFVADDKNFRKDDFTKSDDKQVSSMPHDVHPKDSHLSGPRTYESFYDDFNTGTSYGADNLKTNLNSTVLKHGCKDFSDPVQKYMQQTPLHAATSRTMEEFISRNYSKNDDEEQPASLECISLNHSNENFCQTYPPDKRVCKWNDSTNHSRLLYKDFFLKKSEDSNAAKDTSKSQPSLKLDGSHNPKHSYSNEDSKKNY